MGMDKWLIYSIISLISWGLWGVALKLASRSLEWHQVYVSTVLSSIILSTALLLYFKGDIISPSNTTGYLYALVAGFLGGAGYIALIKALEHGSAPVVIALTSLYPVIVAILSVILLGEAMGIRKIAGLGLAIIAIILLSTS